MYCESPPVTIVINAAPKHLGGGLTNNGMPSADNTINLPLISLLSCVRFKIRMIAIDRPSHDPSQDHHCHDHNGPSCYHLVICRMGGAGRHSATLGLTLGKSPARGVQDQGGEDIWSSLSSLVEHPNSTFEWRSYSRKPIIATATMKSLSNSLWSMASTLIFKAALRTTEWQAVIFL